MSSLEVVLEGPRGRAELLDRYVEFVAARCRRNTVIATVSDLRVFFAVIDKDPAAVTPADVFEFISTQRRGDGDGRVVRLVDGEAGMAARTIRRRLAVMSGLFNWLVLCGEMGANPVPRGMATRRSGAGGQPSGSPLIRTPRTLPKVLDPADVIALLGAARHWRDRAMLEAMVLGGLRCCEVIGLRLEDLQPTQRLVFIADGKGGRQRRPFFFTAAGRCVAACRGNPNLEVRRHPAEEAVDRSPCRCARVASAVQNRPGRPHVLQTAVVDLLLSVRPLIDA